MDSLKPAKLFSSPRLCTAWVIGVLALLTVVGQVATAEETKPSATAGTVPSPAETPAEDAFDDLLDEEDEFLESEGFPDPMESLNRKTLRFNHYASKFIIRPISRSYDFIMPDPLKFAIRRVFKNLNAPVTFTNDMVQLEWKDAAVTTGAFVVNSTVGLGGLFEPAAKIGMPRHRSDFGQSLALAEVDSGPYVVIPFMGPTCLRDGGGTLVDLVMRPATWFFGFGLLASIYTGGEAIVTLETHERDLEELEKSSVDFYPVLRSAYYQTRMGEIWNRRQHRLEDPEVVESYPDRRDDRRRIPATE